MLNITRSTALHTTKMALHGWAIGVMQTVRPFPALPGAARPWNEADFCTAVIRGGGAMHSATAALAYTGPDGRSHLELFRSRSRNPPVHR